MYEDSKQRLWIGTQHNGIDIFDRQRLTFIHLSHGTKNGELGNVIVSINEDETAAFWIVTDEGICRLTVSDKNVPEKDDGDLRNFFDRHQLLITHVTVPGDTDKNKQMRLCIDGNNVFAQMNSGIYRSHSCKLIQKLSSSSATNISYILTQTYSSAKIVITDKLGKTLKEINLSGSGKGSLNVDASTLPSGAYRDALYVNDKLIDSRQMEHIK